MTALDRFAFVLFRPKSPGNIGACARALKNMGLRDLRLVEPPPAYASRAAAMAVHADDVLASAQVCLDLASAISDRTLVVGTTAREGLYRSGTVPIREAASALIEAAAANRIAVVFGPEDCGLTNEEIKLCQQLVTISTAPGYPSLNLAQAVLIVAYELLLASGSSRSLGHPVELAPSAEVEAMLARMAQALVAVGFLPEANPDHIMFALRNLYGRAGLTPRELDILSGIARQVRWCAEGGYESLAAKRQAGKRLR